MPMDNPKERKDRCASCGHLRIRHFLVSMTDDCCLHGHQEMGTPAKCKCKKYIDRRSKPAPSPKGCTNTQAIAAAGAGKP